MQLAILNEWGTFFAALVAAITGIVTVWRQRGGDKIYVGWGSLDTFISSGVELYVVNQSSHTVHLQDYGAVLFSGELTSFPADCETSALPPEFSGYLVQSGSLEPHARAAAGMEYPGRVAGVYAYTATHWRPRIAFSPDIAWRTRQILRCKIWARAWRYRN